MGNEECYRKFEVGEVLMDGVRLILDKTKGVGIIKSSYLDEIREHFSVENEKAEMQRKQGKHAVDRFYTIKHNGHFRVGLLFEILKYCNKNLTQIPVYVDEELKKECIPKIDTPVVETSVSLRGYQKDSIDRAFKYGRGIQKIGTGGGKTLVMATMLESFYKDDESFIGFIIVPTLNLVSQTYTDFKKYNVSFRFSKWTGDEDYDPTSNVVITNVLNFLSKASPKISKPEQALYKYVRGKSRDELKEIYAKVKEGSRVYNHLVKFFRIKKKKFIIEENNYRCLFEVQKRLDKLYEDLTFIDNFYNFSSYLMVDECHGINSTAKISTYVDKFVTNHKFGFTGTVSKKNLDYWKNIGSIGPVIYTRPSKELRDDGFLSDAKIQIIKIIHKDIPDYERMKKPAYNFNKELEFCFRSSFRNNIVKTILSKLDKNSLIIVERIEQGQILYDLLKTIPNKEVFYITGDMPVDERDMIKEKMEINDNVICIAISKIFSVGISINNIHYLVFMSMGKSFIKVIQSIGRGLRKHPLKNKLIVFDICDDLMYSVRHLNERMLYYDEEQFEFVEKKFYE